jgi:GH24 family phage-related lysozyme (muramidase)
VRICCVFGVWTVGYGATEVEHGAMMKRFRSVISVVTIMYYQNLKSPKA